MRFERYIGSSRPPEGVIPKGQVFMGMFDCCRPAAELRCPACQRVLQEWQGKDGPRALFVWVEGTAAPVSQEVSHDVRLHPPQLQAQRLPPSFGIYSSDFPDHHPIAADGVAPEGVWLATRCPYAQR